MKTLKYLPGDDERVRDGPGEGLGAAGACLGLQWCCSLATTSGRQFSFSDSLQQTKDEVNNAF